MEKNQVLKETFNKEYTLFVKGIAILILVFHHLSMVNFTFPALTSGIFVVLTKVCVSLFVILSGYGMTKSYESKKETDFSFVKRHLKKILFNYWWVYIPMFILSFFFHKLGNPFQIYGTDVKGFFAFILDFFGLRALLYTPTLNWSWWFIEAIIIYYLLFPLLYKSVKKYPIVTFFISLIPAISASFFCGIPHVLVYSDRELYYFFPFLVGIFLADKNILDSIVKYSNNKNNRVKLIVISIALVAISQMLVLCDRYQIISNYFYAFMIIVLCIGLKNINKYFNIVLETLGLYSMNIFLVHSFYHDYFTISYNIISKIFCNLLKYLYILILSFVTSVLLEKIKKIARK